RRGRAARRHRRLPGLVRRRRRADAGEGRPVSRLALLLVVLLAAALALAVLLGETSLSAAQLAQAFRDPASPPGEVLWAIRAPRAATAAVVGAGLGLAGAALQGLLRNPLADPGVLGVSASSGLGAALAIA